MLKLILDTAATTTTTEASSADLIMPVVFILFMFALMYFTIYRPQKKRDKQLKEQLDAMRVGDKVITIGGIVGVAAHITDDDVTLYTSAANTPVTFTKSAIQTVVPRNSDSGKGTSEKKTKKEEKKEDKKDAE